MYFANLAVLDYEFHWKRDAKKIELQSHQLPCVGAETAGFVVVVRCSFYVYLGTYAAD